MFTKEMINDYANKLLIGLTEEETDMIQSEFEEIEKNMNLLNEIDNLKDAPIQSYPYDIEVSNMRSGNEVCEEINIEELLSNCDRVDNREVEVPKVVG